VREDTPPLPEAVGVGGRTSGCGWSRLVGAIPADGLADVTGATAASLDAAVKGVASNGRKVGARRRGTARARGHSRSISAGTSAGGVREEGVAAERRGDASRMHGGVPEPVVARLRNL